MTALTTTIVRCMSGLTLGSRLLTSFVWFCSTGSRHLQQLPTSRKRTTNYRSNSTCTCAAFGIEYCLLSPPRSLPCSLNFFLGA
jgi:hypothetical protein